MSSSSQYTSVCAVRLESVLLPLRVAVGTTGDTTGGITIDGTEEGAADGTGDGAEEGTANGTGDGAKEGTADGTEVETV